MEDKFNVVGFRVAKCCGSCLKFNEAISDLGYGWGMCQKRSRPVNSSHICEAGYEYEEGNIAERYIPC